MEEIKKQIRLNSSIIINYENDLISQVTQEKWEKGINQILTEELEFELNDIDSNVKITAKTSVGELNQRQNQSVIKILKELNIELARNAYYSEYADDDVLDMYKLNLLFENKIKELEKKDEFL